MTEYIEKLKLNEIGILPHDTIPGIIARMTETNAKKILEIKKRSIKKGFIILIPNKNHLNNLVPEIKHQTEKLIEKYWPGPLTIIFNKMPSISTIISGSKQTIAIRYPKHKLLNNILESLNEPLITTSANITNEPYISKELLSKIDFIHPDIDPATPKGISSTIIDGTKDSLPILRQGEILISS